MDNGINYIEDFAYTDFMGDTNALNHIHDKIVSSDDDVYVQTCDCGKVWDENGEEIIV